MSELSLFDAGAEIRRCKTCNTVKLLTEFVRRAGIPSRTCKQCESERSLARYYADPDRLEKNRANNDRRKSSRRDWSLRRRFGMTLDEFEQRVTAQNGVCSICGKPCPRSDVLSVDHDHETGQVRGLLCHPCNSGLGLFRDSPDLLLAAASYLLQHNGVLHAVTDLGEKK